MRKIPAPATILLAAALAAPAAWAPACAPNPMRSQLAFGLWASRNNLWDEAVFRWTKAVAADPGSVAAHNNLAVAYEKKGRTADALREYELALKLDPNNAYVKSNYRGCKENSRPPEAETPAAPPKKSGTGVGGGP